MTPDLSAKKSGIKLFGSDGPDFDDGPLPPRNPRATQQKRPTKSKGKGRRGSSPDDTTEAAPEKPVFRLPSDDLDDPGGPIDHRDKAESEHAPDSGNEDDDGDDADLTATQIPTEARCPMCHEPVDGELLAKHSDRGGRMSIRKQTAFCRLHKRREAARAGSARGYPAATVDWAALEGRMAGHEGFLREVLEGSRASHYAAVLRAKVAAGRDRTLLKTEGSVTPGYYGPRGLRAMTDFVVRRLADRLRRAAVRDRLVAARGYTAYVQAVLVPELAARLVMEDLGVDEHEARRVLADSIDVGELLNDDDGEDHAVAGEDLVLLADSTVAGADSLDGDEVDDDIVAISDGEEQQEGKEDEE